MFNTSNSIFSNATSKHGYSVSYLFFIFFISLTILTTTLTCFILIWFLNFSLGVLFFSKLLVSIMPIISDEQICPEGGKENEDIYANIMQNSNFQGKIFVWKMEFDLEEHAHQWYNEYDKEVGFSIQKQWKNE